MDRIESEAVNEPLNAKILSLDTLANSSLENEAIWPKMGMDVPTVCENPPSDSRSLGADSDLVFQSGLV